MSGSGEVGVLWLKSAGCVSPALFADVLPQELHQPVVGEFVIAAEIMAEAGVDDDGVFDAGGSQNFGQGFESGGAVLLAIDEEEAHSAGFQGGSVFVGGGFHFGIGSAAHAGGGGEEFGVVDRQAHSAGATHGEAGHHARGGRGGGGVGSVDEGDKFLDDHPTDLASVTALAAIGEDDQHRWDQACRNALGHPAGEAGGIGAFVPAHAVEEVDDRIALGGVVGGWRPDHIADVMSQGGAFEDVVGQTRAIGQLRVDPGYWRRGLLGRRVGVWRGWRLS